MRFGHVPRKLWHVKSRSRNLSNAPNFIPRLLFFIFALIGTAFILVSAALALEPARRSTTYAHADGRVVDYVIQDGHSTYLPVVEFTTPDGQRHKFKGTVASTPVEYRLEQKVSVLYNPNNPADATLNSFFELWLLPMIFAIIGGIFALVGWIGFFKVKI